LTSWAFGTSRPADEAPYVIVKPVDASPVTVTVPAKPEMALIAFWTFVAVYAWLVPPITAESFPPMRTWKGELYVTVPPPVVGRPAVGFVNVNERAFGTEATVNVPL
jgi:hypothetical protein